MEAPTAEAFITSFSWVLNWSLSFAHQQWDVIAVPPSTFQDKLSEKDRRRDELIRLMVGRSITSLFPKSDVVPGEVILKVENLARAKNSPAHATSPSRSRNWRGLRAASLQISRNGRITSTKRRGAE